MRRGQFPTVYVWCAVVAAFLAGLLAPLWAVNPAKADGIVGSGSPGSCTEAAFDNALSLGGTITFNCGTAPAVIVFTTQKSIGMATDIRGGGRVILSGGNSTSLFQVFSGQTLSLRDITLTRGYGMYGAIQNFGTVVITNSQIQSSTATTNGGGIDNFGELRLVSTTVAYNSASSGYGGGIYDEGGSISLIASFIDNNTSIFAGGMYLVGSATLDRSHVDGNHTDGGGSGIFAVDTANLTVSNSVISYNTTVNGHAAGVRNSGILTVTNSTFMHNQALGGLDGGAIDNLGTANVSGTTFYSNVATETGGAVFNGGTLLVTNSTFAENDGYQGGALGNYGAVTMTGVSLINNTSRFGGGIYNTIGAVMLINVTLSGNRATPATFNSSVGGLGGGIHNNYPNGQGTVYLLDSTVAGNSATKNGGAILSGAPNTVTLKNTIVANSPLGGNCYGSTFPSPLTIQSDGFNIDSDGTCTLFGTRDQVGVDPRLGPLSNYGGPTLTRMPLPGSPAIDNGQCLFSVPVDQRGVVRPQGLACDIGAVERAAADNRYTFVYAPLLLR
jgi:hypothetical protein